MTATLDDLRQEIRILSGIASSGFVDDSTYQLDAVINTHYLELCSLLIAACDDYFLDGYEFSTVSGQSSYDLPTNFRQLRSLQVINGSNISVVEKFNMRDAGRVNNINILNAFYQVTKFSYMIRAGSLFFAPVPAQTQSVVLYFIRQPAKLVNSSDLTDSTIPDEFLDFLKYAAVATLLGMEESDNTFWIQQREAARQRIIDSRNRDLTPDVVPFRARYRY